MARLLASTRMNRGGGNENKDRDLAAPTLPTHCLNGGSVTSSNPSTSNNRLTGSNQLARGPAQEPDLPPLPIPRKPTPQARLPYAAASDKSWTSSLTSLSTTSADDARVFQDAAFYNIPSHGSATEYYDGQSNVGSTTQLPGSLPAKSKGLYIFDLPRDYTVGDVAKLVIDHGGEIKGKIIMNGAGEGASFVTVRLKSSENAKWVQERLNGTKIGGQDIEVVYEVDSTMCNPSMAHGAPSSPRTEMTSAVSLSTCADNGAKGKGLLKKMKSNRPTKTKEVSIGPDEAAWVSIKNIHRNISQAKLEKQ